MSDETRNHFEEQERREKQNRVHAAAQSITTDKRLRIVLLNFESSERRKMYALLLPHLPFKPSAYQRVMRRTSWKG